jgi:antitoxin CcdA
MSDATGPERDPKRDEEWRRANAEAIASYNRYVECNGLPLARYRRF